MASITIQYYFDKIVASWAKYLFETERIEHLFHSKMPLFKCTCSWFFSFQTVISHKCLHSAMLGCFSKLQ